VESQGISYTAGVPPVAAAMLVAQGVWDPKTMVNVEELDPDPFIGILNKIGLPTDVKEIKPGSQDSFNGTVRDLDVELAESTATVTVSAANPMIAFDAKAQARALIRAARAVAAAKPKPATAKAAKSRKTPARTRKVLKAMSGKRRK
jgi:hypothetical protein